MAVMVTYVVFTPGPTAKVSCDTSGDIGSEPSVPGDLCGSPCPLAHSPGPGKGVQVCECWEGVGAAGECPDTVLAIPVWLPGC